MQGKGSSKDTVEFPYLGKDQKVMAINAGEGVCDLVTLEGFNLLSISDKELEDNQAMTASKRMQFTVYVMMILKYSLEELLLRQKF